jgi:hypothetical protein
VVYEWVIYGSAGGLRIYGWVFGGLRVIPAARGHGVPIGQIIIQIIAAPGGVSCATIIVIIIIIMIR